MFDSVAPIASERVGYAAHRTQTALRVMRTLEVWQERWEYAWNAAGVLLFAATPEACVACAWCTDHTHTAAVVSSFFSSLLLRSRVCVYLASGSSQQSHQRVLIK